jgi:hypothetical protein
MLRAAAGPVRLAALCSPSRAARLSSPPPRARALRIMAATHVSVPSETLQALAAQMRPTDDVFDMIKNKQVVLIGESRRVTRLRRAFCVRCCARSVRAFCSAIRARACVAMRF